MSERERWIVYPLLFFALGAAIRDKLFHQVRTDDVAAQTVRADKVICTNLTVVDPANPSQELARLVPVSGNIVARNGEPYRFGALLLNDNDGKEIFAVANDTLNMRHIQCDSIVANGDVLAKRLAVIDPERPRVKLAQLTVGRTQPPKSETFGAVILTDHQGAELFGVVNDRMVMRQIQCEGIEVIDPQNPGQPLLRLPEAPASE